MVTLGSVMSARSVNGPVAEVAEYTSVASKAPQPLGVLIQVSTSAPDCVRVHKKSGASIWADRPTNDQTSKRENSVLKVYMFLGKITGFIVHPAYWKEQDNANRLPKATT